MKNILAKVYCSMCNNLLDDDGSCMECEVCNGENMRGEGIHDPVNKPSHYTNGNGIECIDYIRQVLGAEGFMQFCHGNFIKYQHRHKYKGKPIQDMEKAQFYLNKMVKTMKEIHEVHQEIKT